MSKPVEEITAYPGRPRAFTDGETHTISDDEKICSYHKPCGGLLFVHPFVSIADPNRFREIQMVVRGLCPPCRCYRSQTDEEYSPLKLLADVRMALKHCRTVEEAEITILEIASSIEMQRHAL